MEKLVNLINNEPYMENIEDIIQINLWKYNNGENAINIIYSKPNEKEIEVLRDSVIPENIKKYIMEEYDIINQSNFKQIVWENTEYEKHLYTKTNKKFWKGKSVTISYTSYYGCFSFSYSGYSDEFIITSDDLEEIAPTLKKIKLGKKFLKRNSELDKNIRKKEQELKKLKNEKEQVERVSNILKDSIGEDEYSTQVLLYEVKKL